MLTYNLSSINDTFYIKIFFLFTYIVKSKCVYLAILLSLSSPPALGLQEHVAIWGGQMQVLMCVWQALYQLRHLLGTPKVFSTARYTNVLDVW